MNDQTHITISRRLVPIVFSLTITSICLFGSAGRLDWWNAWLLLGLNFGATVAGTVVTWRNTELLAERRNVKAGQSWDKPIVPVVVLLGPVATWITAGLDTRFHWSRGMPSFTLALAVGVAIAAVALITWAMQSNTFFSAVVRIQKDRGHVVITGGPYRFVRHPGYAGIAAFTLATPFILNSLWAVIPALITAAVSVLRTALEDCVLHNELDGYVDYGRTVTFKLLPYVW